MPDHGLPDLGHGRRVLVAQQMSAQPGFGALGILEFHDGHPLDGFLAHAEKAGGDLGDHVVVIGPHPLHVPALPGAGKGIPRGRRTGFGQLGDIAHRPEGHAAAIPGHIDLNLGPPVFPVVQQNAGVDLVIVEVHVAVFPEI